MIVEDAQGHRSDIEPAQVHALLGAHLLVREWMLLGEPAAREDDK